MRAAEGRLEGVWSLIRVPPPLTNSEGKILNYTNEFIETILLQLNSSNNYYTTGDDDVILIGGPPTRN